MLPPTEVLTRFKSKEEPASYPSGQDTSFKNLTPMPFRFTEQALPDVNQRHASPKSPVLPHYSTTAAEVGKLHLSETDLPMRWYGRSGNFTSSWVAPPKTRVSTGLNSSMDHSNVHHRCVTHPRPLASRLCASRHVLAMTLSPPSLLTKGSRIARRVAQPRPGVEWTLGPHRLQRGQSQRLRVCWQGAALRTSVKPRCSRRRYCCRPLFCQPACSVGIGSEPAVRTPYVGARTASSEGVASN